MTGATAANWAMQWTYDEFGNRLTQTGTGDPVPPPMTLTYNQATNRITTSGYTYDYNGNLIAMPGISGIQWDVFDRMTQATANGTTTQYTYDAMGRRMVRVGPSGTDFFFYDVGERLLAAYPWTNPSQPQLTRYFAGQKLTHYTDRVGSVRYASGVTNHYYPYGELVAGASNTGFKFAETYRDDSGLDYAMARYYASGIARFLSVDSGRTRATSPQSYNRYAYSRNDPINGRDPGGRDMMYIGPCTFEYVRGPWEGPNESDDEVWALVGCETKYMSDPRSERPGGGGGGGGGAGDEGGDPSKTRLDPAASSEIRNQAYPMLDNLTTDCGDFVTLTLKAAYLLKSGRSLEDLAGC